MKKFLLLSMCVLAGLSPAQQPAEPSNDNGKENYLRTSPNGRWADSAKEWDAYTTLPIVGYRCEWKGK